MCGITGFTGNQNKGLLLKMLNTIKHRGPDEKILFFDSNINAGMARLSIIDLRKNLYPMEYKNLVLLYNGEIYNFKELKKQLEKKGITFKTNSDAEVILPLFHLYGPRIFLMLEGMFAIFIYDKNAKKIYLARDKTGEKPVYYIKKENFFAFASEFKALLKTQRFEEKIDFKSISSYLYQGHVFAPNTIIKNIKKIPPRHFLEYNLKKNTLKLSSYWPNFWTKNNTLVKKNNEFGLTQDLEKLISKSVKNQLAADVPVGCFLSGGVDSSLITYFAGQHLKKLKTYSISFPDFKEYDESKYAQMAAKICKTKHIFIPCTAQKIRPIIENIGLYIDEPIIDAAFLPLFLLAEQTAKENKVVLTGDGGDELFAGYNRYQIELRLQKLQKLIRLVPFYKPILKSVFPDKFDYLTQSLEKHYSSQRIWTLNMIKKLMGDSFSNEFRKRAFFQNEDLLLFMQKTDLLGFLPEQLLMKTDKATMLHSLEARNPYLDSKILNFALNLTNNDKIKNNKGKYILKKVAEKYFPNKLIWRKKHGFSVPLKYWFQKELKDIVLQSVCEIKKYPYWFNAKYYQFIVSQHLERQKDWTDNILGIVVLTRFLKLHRPVK